MKQLTAAFEAEKNRAICAEQELAAVMQGKTQSEQELTGMITALNETKTLQGEYLTRLKGELEREAERRVSAENQAESLRVEKEQSETSLRFFSILLFRHTLMNCRERYKPLLQPSKMKRTQHNP